MFGQRALRRARSGAAALFLACFFAAPAHAASFDCAKAKSADEKAVCADDELSTLDEHLGRYYETAIVELQDGAQCLKADQGLWLGKRAACADNDCLEALYLDRLAELDALQWGMNKLEIDLPARPALIVAIAPAPSEDAAAIGQPQSQSTEPLAVEGKLSQEEGGYLVAPEEGTAYAVVDWYLSEPTIFRLQDALIATAQMPDARFLVQGYKGGDEGGQAIFDTGHCIAVYRLP